MSIACSTVLLLPLVLEGSTISTSVLRSRGSGTSTPEYGSWSSSSSSSDKKSVSFFQKKKFKSSTYLLYKDLRIVSDMK